MTVREGSSSIPTSPIAAAIPTLEDQFRSLLTDRKYLDAANVVKVYLNDEGNSTYRSHNYKLNFLRGETMRHFKEIPESVAECTSLLDSLAATDIKEEAYGLHIDWINADAALFQGILQAYIRALLYKGFSKEQLLVKLSSDLAGFLTYRGFNCEQARIFIANLPGFDPTKPSSPMYANSDTYLELAQKYNKNQDLVSYLESLSPAPSSIKTDYREFCGVAELKGKAHEMSMRINKGEFVQLDTPLKIYEFIGKNPVIEGDEKFFKNEVYLLVEQSHYSPQQALEIVRNTQQKTYSAFAAVKSLLEHQDIEVYGAESLSLDGSNSDGHKNVGIVTLNGMQVFCKFTANISKFAINGFSIIKDECDFVRNARMLRTRVPNVVEILPNVILSKSENGEDIKVGHFMKIVPGNQLRKISQLSSEEAQAIQTQFDSAVNAMFESGYALYDFSDDNVIWDGKTLTFIDLSAAGFTSRALENANTYAEMDRMSFMLMSKTLSQSKG